MAQTSPTVPEAARAPLPHEIRPMLKLVLGRDGRPAGEDSVLDFLRYAQQRRLDLSTARVMSVGKRLAFAVVPMPAPGGTGMLLCPSALGRGVGAEAAGGLIQCVTQGQFEAGMGLLQVLLPVWSADVRAVFERLGFSLLAELIYLQRKVRRPPRARELILPPGLRLAEYSPATHGLFARAIERSYIASLDCPALAGKRTIEQIMLGHQSAGEFRPGWWHVLLEEDSNQPLGVLLLSGVGNSGSGGLELVYLGLAPEARGRGLGDSLLRVAAQQAHLTPGKTLTLAVDAGNAPALALYRRHGFRRLQQRLALMRERP